jgi:hypothetical protein
VGRVVPPLAIEGTSLRSFLAWVCREQGWALRFSDERLAVEASSIRLAGTMGEVTPGEALDAVIPTTGLQYEVEEGVLLVVDPEKKEP